MEGKEDYAGYKDQELVDLRYPLRQTRLYTINETTMTIKTVIAGATNLM